MRLAIVEHTYEEISARLAYDPTTGVLTWTKPKGVVKKGTRAGAGHLGYRRLRFGKRQYLTARIAWLLFHGVWPPNELEVEHKNLVRDDDRINNLRLATHGQNMANRHVQRQGLKGASLKQGRWRARIAQNGVSHLLGIFDTEEEAHEAYSRAAAEVHGEFARTA